MANLVQSITNSGNSTSPTATFNMAPTSGNLVIAIIYWNSVSVATTFAAGTNISTNLSQAINGDTSTMRLDVYSNIAGSAWPSTYSGTLSGTKEWVVHLLEYSHVLAAPLDKTATATGTSATASSGTTATTTLADELWLMVVTSRSTTAQTSPTNGFVQVLQTSTGGDLVAGCYAQQVNTTGAANGSVTVANSQWQGGVATYKLITVPELAWFATI